MQSKMQKWLKIVVYRLLGVKKGVRREGAERGQVNALVIVGGDYFGLVWAFSTLICLLSRVGSSSNSQ